MPSFQKQSLAYGQLTLVLSNTSRGLMELCFFEANLANALAINELVLTNCFKANCCAFLNVANNLTDVQLYLVFFPWGLWCDQCS
ncbi:hypothetical protein MRX96_036683 [Rhipicephalus microplus]